MAEKFIPSSGNIFDDLGFEPVEAEELRLRSDLLIALTERIHALGKSQAIVATLLGISQPRVSNLLHGKLHLFSLKALVDMLGCLGNTVDVSVRPVKTEHITLQVVKASIRIPAEVQYTAGFHLRSDVVADDVYEMSRPDLAADTQLALAA